MPQPFAHAPDSTNRIVEPRTEIGGIAVLPVTGVPETTSHALSDALAEALGKYDIPAARGLGNRRSKFVDGTATVRPAGKGSVQVDIIWDLIDPSGKLLGTRRHSQTLPAADWRGGGREVMRSLTREVAAEIAAIVHAPADKAAQALAIPLHVWPVDGAPPGDHAALQQAMESALRRRDFAVTPSLDGARVVVAGALTLGPVKADRRPIEITWSVLDSDGQQLGKLTQRNAVPTAALKSGWKTLAAVIAENAAGGVTDLLRRLPPGTLKGGPKGAK